MTTARQLVDRTIEDFLMTGQRLLRAKLATGMNASTDQLTFTTLQGSVAEGSMLQIDFELMPVWTLSGSTVTVERGDFGSTPTAHLAGDIIEVDPIFTRQRVLRAIQAEIQSLSDEPGIWTPTIVDLTLAASTEVYDLGANEIRGVVDVHELVQGDWVPIRSSWELVRGLANKTGFTGDAGLRLNHSVRSTSEVRVICESPLATIDASTTDVETSTGLPNATLLAVGAAIQLNAGRAIKRSFLEHQGDTRRANEVAPYQTENSSRELKALYKTLKEQTITRLSQMYPHRRKRR